MKKVENESNRFDWDSVVQKCLVLFASILNIIGSIFTFIGKGSIVSYVILGVGIILTLILFMFLFKSQKDTEVFMINVVV
ncbi:MAG: hypothetical protein J6P16_03315 [Eubacterium sp.]|nr:hypothetical protein [Eubacterium sp.]